VAAFKAGELKFFSNLAGLTEPEAFKAHVAPLRKIEWVVYAKRPFAGPSQVLAYLARYTHRIAIANGRLVALSAGNVSFRWKDYRQDGNSKVMTLAAGEFIRRFLLHTLPDGFHRIRHYGLFANGHRTDMLNLCRTLSRHVIRQYSTHRQQRRRSSRRRSGPTPLPLLWRADEHYRDIRRPVREPRRFPRPTKVR